MKILTTDNLPFELNQPTHKLIDAKMCVLDASNKEYKDFFFKKITNYVSYRYPTVELKVFDEKDTFYITLPLNWKIISVDDVDYICDLINIEELLHYEHTIPVFNPLHIGVPRLMNVKITNVNSIMIEHFVPRLPKKNLLVMPMGVENQWYQIYENGKKVKFPPCILAMDDIDNGGGKIVLDYFNDIIG